MQKYLVDIYNNVTFERVVPTQRRYNNRRVNQVVLELLHRTSYEYLHAVLHLVSQYLQCTKIILGIVGAKLMEQHAGKSFCNCRFLFGIVYWCIVLGVSRCAIGRSTGKIPLSLKRCLDLIEFLDIYAWLVKNILWKLDITPTCAYK